MLKHTLHILFLCLLALPVRAETVVIGSKNFSESKILTEILAQMIEKNTDLTVDKKLGLGGTHILFEALKSGEIDIYPEYTGTAWQAILKEKERIPSSTEEFLDRLREKTESQFSLTWLSPFGFNNTYAIAVKEGSPLNNISDIKAVEDDIVAGFSYEFIERADGVANLEKHYGIEFKNKRGLEHGLKYMALHQGEVNLIESYSTDGKLKKFTLKLLKDDKNFFPPYHAAPLVRQKTLEKHPELKPLLESLHNEIDDTKMQELNYMVEVEQEQPAEVARQFLVQSGLIKADAEDSKKSSFWNPPVDLVSLTRQHFTLAATGTLLAILLGVPVGLLISRKQKVADLVISGTGVLQTIPSLALLGLMIPLVGIGTTPAVIALFLYALLPIVRNTYTGIKSINPELKQSAKAIGMTSAQILFMVELPMATKVIMAGVRTATVINIGTATLAAFIGAGGLGEPIFSGLSLNNHSLILWGAVPAAILAVVVDFILGKLESFLQPKGLKIKAPV